MTTYSNPAFPEYYAESIWDKYDNRLHRMCKIKQPNETVITTGWTNWNQVAMIDGVCSVTDYNACIEKEIAVMSCHDAMKEISNYVIDES